MSKIFRFLKSHLLSILLSSFFIIYAALSSYKSYFTIWIKIKSFGLNFFYYWVSLFKSKTIFPPQILEELNNINKGHIDCLVPENIKTFFERLGYSFRSIIGNGYLNSLLNKMFGNVVFIQILLSMLVILIPVIIVLVTLFFKPKKFSINKKSKSFLTWNKFYEKVIKPIRLFCFNQFVLVLKHKYVRITFLISLLIYFNVPSLVFDFLAYYFYFIAKFDFKAIWESIYVMLIDLTPSLINIPLWFYLLVNYYLFCSWRKHLAKDILKHHDALNCGFVKGSGVLIMINGAPGAGKTLLQTDMSITCEMIFRQQAKEIMDEIRNIFPNFRFDLLRKKLDLWIKQRKIINLVDCESFVRYILSLFYSSVQFNNGIWNYYDYKKYGFYFNNALKHESLFDDLLDYSKAYFIYQSDFALLISNYPIRAEHRLVKNEHMVQFNYDYFRDECFDFCEPTYSKVVDYDMLRLAKKKQSDNPKANIPIAYVFALTELGKERGNSLDNQELKKKTEETNQKNDGFTDYLRVGRHPATIRNRTFFKIFFDEQRASSCGVALSGIAEDIITIDKKRTETKNSMYFYFIRLLIMSLSMNISNKFFAKYEPLRNDLNLATLFFSWLSRKSNRSYIRYVNNYSYKKIKFYIQNGTLPEGVENVGSCTYYLAYKKIFASRYASDYLRTFFDVKGKTSGLGIGDLPEYLNIYPTWDQLQSQNSYFGEQLNKNLLTLNWDDLALPNDK